MHAKFKTGIRSIRLHLDLMKIPLSLLISISAVFGFALKKDSFNVSLLLTTAGVFALACGSGALNNFQDRHIDRLLSRTKDRPLPAGHLKPSRALILSAALISMGLYLLYSIGHHIRLPILGGFAVFLYNGLYTPYKHKMSLALIAGAFCGMIPPLIGWTAAGGNIFSTRIWVIMMIFGFWQLPHFWLVLLHHWPDYRQSILPNILRRFTRRQLEKIVFIWIINFAVMLFAVPVVCLRTGHFTGWIIACTAVSLMITAVLNILLPGVRHDYRRLFMCLNGTIFLVMITIISSSFFHA